MFFSYTDGKLYHKGRVVIPSSASSVSKLLEEFHCTPTGGHSRFYMTYRMLVSHVYWLGLLSPFDIVYGRPPQTILQFVVGEVKCKAVARELVDRDEALKQLKYHLSRPQERMKKSVDKHRWDEAFSVGDWVFLKQRPHRQQSVIRWINQ